MAGLRSLATSDAAVQKTNDDAQISKASCVRTGYFQDEFLQYFVRKGSAKRAPLINRGYYARMAAIKQLIQSFISSSPAEAPRQILSLGAGFDTTYFHLKANGSNIAKYFEIDFLEVVRKKVQIIQANKQLSELIDPSPDVKIEADQCSLVSSSYVLMSGDLREADALLGSLQSTGFDLTVPTLIIAECVLVYMPADASQRLVSKLGSILPDAAFIIYEQSRGCPLIGIYATPDLEKQQKRFTDHNWQSAWALDMKSVYQSHIDPQDKARIERLEIFDELEEWHLIQEHYCLAVGVNARNGTLQNFALPHFPSQQKPVFLPNAD